MSEQRLGSRIATGAAWMVGLRLLDRSIGIVSLAILARLLMPGDFGLVAMATALIAVIEMFMAFNFDIALIQNREVVRSHYDTAWTLNIVMASACALCLAAVAVPAGAFYGDSRLAPVIWWLAFATWIRGFENIGVVAFRKDLEFHREFGLLLAKRIGVFMVTVAVALATRSYWALVIGILAGALFGVVLSYALHPYRPRLDKSAWRKLLQFSRWAMFTNIVDTIAHRSADLIIGKALGPGPLGLFNLAHEIGNLPTTELSAPINRATYPGYAKVAADESQLRAHFLEVQGLTAILTVPAAIGVAAIAPILVPFLLGAAWHEAIPLLEILAVSGLLASWRTNIGYIFLAVGRPGTVSIITMIRLMLLIPALTFGTIHFGTIGAAWAILAMSVAMLPVTHYFAIRLLHLRASDYLGVLWRPLMAGGVMAILIRQFLEWSGGGFGALAAMIILGAMTYVAGIALLWAISGFPASVETRIHKVVVERLDRFRAKPR